MVSLFGLKDGDSYLKEKFMIKEYVEQYRQVLKSKANEIILMKDWIVAEFSELPNRDIEPRYNPDKGTLNITWNERRMELSISFNPKAKRWVMIFATEHAILIQKDYDESELEKMKNDFAETVAALYV